METNYPTAGTETTGRHRDTAAAAAGSAATATASGGKVLRMREELSNLKSDLDALMSHATTLSETELSEARDRILARFSSMRFAARGFAEQAGRQFSQGRDITADYVRDKPLQSVAIAAGVGLLVGAIMRRG